MTTPSDPNDPNQGYQSGQSGLPQFPAAPPPSEYGQQPETYTPPKEIVASFWCYIGGAVVVLLGGLLAIGQKQAILDALRSSNTTNATEAQLEAAANLVVIIAIVISVVLTGLYVLFAYKLRAGRNWARVVLTVLAVLTLINLVSTRGGSAIGYIGELAVVVGCVLSYLPNSSGYFAAMKSARFRG